MWMPKIVCPQCSCHIPRTTPEERFWSQVDKSKECWEWVGYCKSNGYGDFSVGRKAVFAHRFSYELMYGPIPESMVICHLCDNPKCVRPDHLKLGTQHDNVHDCIKKGRRRYVSTPRKLTIEQVREIRTLGATGISFRKLAICYSVAPSTISDIITGKLWKESTSP